MRVVKIRTGMVLGPGGGALARLVSAFKTKMGGKLGSGKQWMPWIHMADIAGLYRYAAEHDISGVLNGTAPIPVRNEEFTEVLADGFGRAGQAGHSGVRSEDDVRRDGGSDAGKPEACLPQAAERAGFTFRFPDRPAALADARTGG